MLFIHVSHHAVSSNQIALSSLSLILPLEVIDLIMQPQYAVVAVFEFNIIEIAAVQVRNESSLLRI